MSIIFQSSQNHIFTIPINILDKQIPVTSNITTTLRTALPTMISIVEITPAYCPSAAIIILTLVGAFRTQQVNESAFSGKED